jgi:predicted GNAT family acetyltransferase
MQVTEYPSAAEFLEVNRDLLMKNEAGNSILLGYASQQVQGVDSAMTTKFFSVDEDNQPLLPAMFTPGIVPLLSEGPDEAARIFARFFFPKSTRPTGVNGPKETALAFADEWERLTRCRLELRMNSRIYSCHSVEKIKLPEGSHRQATKKDFKIVRKWRHAFRDEVDGFVITDDDYIRSQIKEGRVHLWEADKPFSVAVQGRDTDNGGTISAVYTPPRLRNHGYATALTAAVTQTILDSGKKYSVLYTDLSNPISNSIYQQIGYEPVMDATMWNFNTAI